MRIILTGEAAETYMQAYAEATLTMLTLLVVFLAVLWFFYTFGVNFGVNTHLKISILLIVFTFFITTAIFGMMPDQVDMIRSGIPIEKAKWNANMNVIILFASIVFGVAASLYPVVAAKRS